MHLMFNQEFIIPDTLKNSIIRTESLKADKARRLENQIDLSRFMNFDLIRGANDSALVEDFDYAIQLNEFTARSMTLKFEFSDPLSISTGRTPDIFRAKIIEPNLFISKTTGKTVEKDTLVEVEVPRQFPTEEELQIIETTGITVEAAASTAGLS